MLPLTYDELNQLVGMKRSVPFEEYFAPMKISDRQKKERIALAERLEEEFLYMLAYMYYAYPNINVDMVNDLNDRYMNALIELGIASVVVDNMADEQIAYRNQAYKFASDAIESTQRHKEDPYYYSEDRARLMSEDQANFIYDTKDFADALEMGYQYKTWETVADNRVRESHAEVEGLTIPIDEPFVLQGGMMMAPHDDSLGVSEDELIMCRCSLSYS